MPGDDSGDNRPNNPSAAARYNRARSAAAQRPPQRIGLVAATLLPADTAARAVLAVAIALLHRLGEALRTLAQRFQRLALRIHRGIGIALAEPAAGVAHRAVGLAKTILTVALVALLTL